ncbi:hypothetical protein ALC60_04648 [Trachymyrmex zeteki]|uniref:DUF8207 domain-containing protein n=1 Tax=Mycetomoellerius zeteki TaxID=64791 RepID=A0A151X812_9HYME|nr:hypothetical protein ALC60_04648 [Trachymyrmex zeteki]
MDSAKGVERERTAKLIAKTRTWIRKKHRALKTDMMENEMALEKRFKPIVEPLKQIVENTEREESTGIMEKKRKNKRERGGDDDDDHDDDDDDDDDDEISTQITPHVFIGDDPLLETTVRQVLKTPQSCERLHSQLGPLGQIYVNALLSGDKKKEIDHVYGVYFDENGTMLGDKTFDVDSDDTIIVDGVRYKSTSGLYELIFKRIPDDAIYTKNDKETYKSILLTTNAHRRRHNAEMPVKSNKEHKYKHIIGPLVGAHSTSTGSGVPSAMRLTDNKIDYIHWDDPNELVDQLQLLDASRQAGNNAHDNEILSIFEELREAGLIINRCDENCDSSQIRESSI